MRRLGAIGTLVWDRIENPFAQDGKPREQWGGAVYSFASLSAACPPGWSVEPIVKIGADLWEEGGAYLRRLRAVQVGGGVVRVPESNNRVLLVYHDLEHRDELQTGGVPGWRWEELAPLLNRIDALYINFLSGVELELSTAQRLRREFDGPIYADLHSLFLGPATRKPRRPQPLEYWREWLACFDAVQLNEDEMALLGPEFSDRDRFESELPHFGPALVVVTAGGQGVRFVLSEGFPAQPMQWRCASRGKEIRRGSVPAPEGRLPGDPTGCGDVWGAAFIAGLLGGLELEESIVRAERMAAAKISHPDTARLDERLSRIAKSEG